jgi:DNA mismatch endonuclease (patch repair protein)
MMSRVRKKNTTPELRVRRLLHRLGFRFRLHRDDLPGKPDIVLPRWRTIIFVNGCFWHCHDCPKGLLKPVHNRTFWLKKLAANQERDVKRQRQLEALGWKVIVIWECETTSDHGLREAVFARLGAGPGTA